MLVFKLYVLNVIDMFLLKCKISGLPEFQSFFTSDVEALKYLDSINTDSIEDWSIHPIFVQEPIKSKDKASKASFTISVQNHGDTRVRPLFHNISIDNLYELVLKDLDFTQVYKLILFPRV